MGLGIWASSRNEYEYEEKKVKIQDIFLDTMNRAFHNDPNAIHSLISNQVPCKQKMVEDKSIVVEDYTKILFEDDSYRVGLLGLLNGILTDARSDELLAAMWQELPTQPIPRRILVGFCLVKK